MAPRAILCESQTVPCESSSRPCIPGGGRHGLVQPEQEWGLDAAQPVERHGFPRTNPPANPPEIVAGRIMRGDNANDRLAAWSIARGSLDRTSKGPKPPRRRRVVREPAQQVESKRLVTEQRSRTRGKTSQGVGIMTGQMLFRDLRDPVQGSPGSQSGRAIKRRRRVQEKDAVPAQRASNSRSSPEMPPDVRDDPEAHLSPAREAIWAGLLLSNLSQGHPGTKRHSTIPAHP